MGDDVVDLCDPETATGARHPRFDERVFTPEESATLSASAAPERLRWALWAAKEAAYKVARKQDPGAVFAPRRFAVRLDGDLTGEVHFGGRRYPVRVRSLPEAVHAVATHDAVSPARVREGLLCHDGDAREASSRVRSGAAEAAAGWLGVPPGEVRVGRRGRIPVLFACGRPAADLSLSHHGRFLSFALLLPAGTENA